LVERKSVSGEGERSIAASVTRAHLTHSPATLEPAAMRAATALAIAVILGLGLPTPSRAQSVLMLDSAIAMAKSNSRLAHIARAKVNEKAAAARGARA